MYITALPPITWNPGTVIKVRGVGYRPYYYGFGNYYLNGLGAEATESPLPGTPEVMATEPASTMPADTTVPVTTPPAETTPPETPVTPTTAEQAKTDQEIYGYFGAMSTSVGMQVFSIIAGVSGSIAGFLLGIKLGNSTRVSTKDIAIASLVGAVGAFVGIFAVRTYH